MSATRCENCQHAVDEHARLHGRPRPGRRGRCTVAGCQCARFEKYTPEELSDLEAVEMGNARHDAFTEHGRVAW